MERILDHRELWLWPVVVVAALILAPLLRRVIVFVACRFATFSKRTKAQWDNLLFETILRTRSWVIFVWLCYWSLPALDASAKVQKAGYVVLIFATTLQIIVWSVYAINHWRENYLLKKVESDPSSAAAISLLGTALQGVMIVIVVLAGLSNLGVDIMALVAGLGVGGIAVALAAQNILGDLLASLSIVLDKPFVIGDFIVIDKFSGTVENIGIKTTRVRSLSGEQLVFTNKDLLENRIQNYQRMHERRVVQKISVEYSTALGKLKNIPTWIKDFIDDNEKLRFDRCHLAYFGASSLEYEFVFYVLSDEYNLFMDLQQDLMFQILEKLRSEEIRIAFPSSSVYVEKFPDDKAPEKSNDMGMSV